MIDQHNEMRYIGEGTGTGGVSVTWSPVVTIVLTSCVSTRCSCRVADEVSVCATVFSSICCVRACVSRSWCVVAVRVVTARARTYGLRPGPSAGSRLSA